MRIFVAVDVRAPTIDGLPSPHDGSPSHLTVLFLGEVPDSEVDPVSERFRTAVAPFPPFVLELRGLGIFPSAQRPRILWAGVREGAEALGRLHAALRAAAGPLAAVEDRAFVPHLTILRVRRPGDADRARWVLDHPPPDSFGSTPIAEVLLKSSLLGREGASHRVIGRFPLEGRARTALRTGPGVDG